MHIGLIIYSSLDTVSGGFLYDRKLVEHLRHNGDTVEIISLPWRKYPQDLVDNFSSVLFHRLRDTQFDILLQDELNHPSLFLLNERLRGKVNYPIISIVHHLRISESHPAWQQFFYRRIEQRYLASVDGFIFNGETTRRAVSDLLNHTEFPNSVVAFPAGDRFNPKITDEQIVARANEPGMLRIVFVGNLIARKGLHTLLDAFARLPSNTVQLTIVGNPDSDSEYTRSIRNKISDLHLTNVEIVGALSDVDLANVFANSHLLVVPSQYEGFGIVYLEGMSFGLPAIGTNAGGASEIIRDGENGFLILPNDATTLGIRIETLAHDRKVLAQMSIAARHRFLAQPTWDESMERIRQILA